MLGSVAVGRVKQLLGFRKNLDAEILQAFVEVQQQLENEAELPWFLRKPYVGLTTAPSVRTVALPADFIREVDEDQLFAFTVDPNSNILIPNPIVKDELGYLRIRFTNNVGLPVGYAIVSGAFNLYPMPDQAYPLNGTYLAHDAVITLNAENLWLKYLPEIIIGRGGIMLSGIRDQTALQVFMAMEQRANTKLNQMTTANDLAGTRLVMGGED